MTNDDVDDWFNDAESDDDFDEGTGDEDVDLALLGISLELADQFRSHYKGKKNIFYGGKLTKQFFEWVLKSCNEFQLGQIKDEYSKYPEDFQKMIDDATPHELLQEGPTWKMDMIQVQSELGYLRQYLKFLYLLLGKINETASYEFNDEEIKMIEKIDEVVNK